MPQVKTQSDITVVQWLNRSSTTSRVWSRMVAMNSIEEFVERESARSRSSLRRQVAQRIRRMVKPKLRGESHRLWIARNLKNSEAGVVFDILQCVIGLLMVQSVLTQNWSRARFSRSDVNRSVDLANLVAITVNFGVRFHAASDRKSFCLHWLSIADVCCWLPLLLELVVEDRYSQQNKYSHRFFLMVRTLRILQIFRLRRLAKTAIARQVILIGLTVFTLLICAGVGLQAIELCDSTVWTQKAGVNCQDLSLFDTMYLVCITIGTVGFGDFAPKSKMAKVASVVLIIFTGMVIPMQISGLTEVLNRETAFDKKYAPDKHVQHILLCGDIENSSLGFFLHSWLRGEGQSSRRRVVILSPTLPTPAVRRILLHRQYEQQVTYLQGSAMNTSDLRRAGASTAAYCFVLVNKHSQSLDQDDIAVNLLTCSIRKSNRHAPLYAQISRSDNLRHVNISGASAVVCMEQLKLAIVAKSMWIRGFNTLVGNLVQCFDNKRNKGLSWVNSYIDGCCEGIYEATIPSSLFTLSTFRSLAVLLYREFRVPLLGIRTQQGSVIVYPIDQDITAFHSVFFLAQSHSVVSKIEKLSVSVFTRHPDLLRRASTISEKGTRPMATVLAAQLRRLSQVFEHRYSLTPIHADCANPHCGGSTVSPMGPDDDVGDTDDFTASCQRRWLPRSSHNLAPDRPHTANTSEDKNDDSVTGNEAVKKATPLLPRSDSASGLTARSTQTFTSEHSRRSFDPESTPSGASMRHLLGPPESGIAAALSSQTRSASKRSIIHAVGSERELKKGASGAALLRRIPSDRSRPIEHRSSKYRSFGHRGPPMNLSGHFVVCGLPSSYASLVANCHDVGKPQTPVVFVTPCDLSEKDISACFEYKTLYFVRGSPVSIEILEEARVFHAESVLITAYCGRESGCASRETADQADEGMADVDAITAQRFIAAACQSVADRTERTSIPNIVVEIMRPSNAKFLDGSELHVDKELIRGTGALDEAFYSPLYASGHVYFSNFMDALLGSTSQNPHLIDILTQLVISGNLGMNQLDQDARSKHRLTQIRAPARYHDEPYALLVEGLLAENVIALAIYRARHELVAPAFVMTNPAPNEIVHRHDLVFVIR